MLVLNTPPQSKHDFIPSGRMLIQRLGGVVVGGVLVLILNTTPARCLATDPSQKYGS